MSKYSRRERDIPYLLWLKSLPCAVDQCRYKHDPITNPIEAAHVGQKGMSQKCPDREAIPLCRMMHSLAKDSHHAGTRTFWAKHNLNREELVAALNQAWELLVEAKKQWISRTS